MTTYTASGIIGALLPSPRDLVSRAGKLATDLNPVAGAGATNGKAKLATAAGVVRVALDVLPLAALEHKFTRAGPSS